MNTIIRCRSNLFFLATKAFFQTNVHHIKQVIELCGPLKHGTEIGTENFVLMITPRVIVLIAEYTSYIFGYPATTVVFVMNIPVIEY